MLTHEKHEYPDFVTSSISEKELKAIEQGKAYLEFSDDGQSVKVIVVKK